ncbi:sigma-70 family RNA polymerase sigma factor [Arthrobacter sp. lap29]|uniref:sigma-70 family RNA polymerase sigma factor n=1 Tax=Arthrobacter sp. lap29 TaxID=3056122 RepID=UPI0028F72396|nr:sigma-70 family RNA polymerase sigma factor [Arthrobacter sp. lap29]
MYVSTATEELPVTHTKDYPQDLRQLLELATAGDTQAFELLYAQTAGHIYPLVRRILKNSVDSMQTVQDIYVRIWAHLADYDPAQSTPQTWVMSIAHRMAVDQLRKSQAMTITGTTERAHPLLNHLSERTAHPTILAELTTIQSEAIYLAYFEGRTTADIAAALGLDQDLVHLNLREGLLKVTARFKHSSRT